MKRIVFFLLVCVSTSLSQQGRLIKNPIRELPVWDRKAVTSQNLEAKYLITFRRYPHLLKGDFNADGRRDVVLQIQEKSGEREGIAIVQGPRPQAEATHIMIVGAGKPSEEFPEDLRSMPRWSLLSKHDLEDSDDAPALPGWTKGDVIRFETADSVARFVYWDGKKFQWHSSRKSSH